MKDRDTSRFKPLTAAFVRTVTKKGRYGDGRGSYGLYLRVWERANGRIARHWGQSIRIDGTETNLGLGEADLVSLADAREKARGNARAVLEGEDPRKIIGHKRLAVAYTVTFGDAVDAVIAARTPSWKPKTKLDWQSIVERHALPALSDKPISEVTTADVKGVIEPLWIASPPTARKLRGNISVVMEWAIAEGHRTDNPASKALQKSLPTQTQKTKSQEALPYADVGAALATIRGTKSRPTTLLCIEFLILTACRSKEARAATWDEIDMDAAVWTVPASKMKAGREHRVPLSDKALAVLERAKTYANATGLVFPSLDQPGKEIGSETLSRLFGRKKLGCVPHGMRSSFRDWAAECSDVPGEIAEHALAHVEGSAVERAYRRTDYFEKRRGLMQDWANYLGQTNDSKDG